MPILWRMPTAFIYEDQPSLVRMSMTRWCSCRMLSGGCTSRVMSSAVRRKGFLFSTSVRAEVQYWKDQVGLDKRLKELDLGKPLSKRMVPQDGWNMVWGPVIKRLYQKQLTELQEGRGVAKDLVPKNANH